MTTIRDPNPEENPLENAVKPLENGDPSAFFHTQGERDWVQRVMEGIKRMNTDEAYRKEIAKDLS